MCSSGLKLQMLRGTHFKATAPIRPLHTKEYLEIQGTMQGQARVPVPKVVDSVALNSSPGLFTPYYMYTYRIHLFPQWEQEICGLTIHLQYNPWSKLLVWGSLVLQCILFGLVQGDMHSLCHTIFTLWLYTCWMRILLALAA